MGVTEEDYIPISLSIDDDMDQGWGTRLATEIKPEVWKRQCLVSSVRQCQRECGIREGSATVGGQRLCQASSRNT